MERIKRLETTEGERGQAYNAKQVCKCTSDNTSAERRLCSKRRLEHSKAECFLLCLIAMCTSEVGSDQERARAKTDGKHALNRDSEAGNP